MVETQGVANVVEEIEDEGGDTMLVHCFRKSDPVLIMNDYGGTPEKDGS